MIPLRENILDCDNIIRSPDSPANVADCNMPCTGNKAEFCGAPYRISIFSHTSPVQVDPGWSSLGCYTFVAQDVPKCCGMLTHVQPFSDSSSSRTLRTAAHLSAGNMTIGSCLEFCGPAGYKYAGVEYGGVSSLFFVAISVPPILIVWFILPSLGML